MMTMMMIHCPPLGLRDNRRPWWLWFGPSSLMLHYHIRKRKTKIGITITWWRGEYS